MTNVVSQLTSDIIAGVLHLYGQSPNEKMVNFSPTKKEFTGDYTLVTFPFTKMAGKGPEQIAEDLGQYLVANSQMVADFNVIKGFLNVSLKTNFWRAFVLEAAEMEDYGQFPANGQKVMVEYSSPNTNKPLHLGHIRNILLGWSSARILEAAGHEVVRVQIINDRGIAICKSMVMWQRNANGATPSSTGTKGDHFVGDYYVQFEKEFSKEYAKWQLSPKASAVFAEKAKDDQTATDFFKAFKNQYFNDFSALGAQTKQMLLDWENGDAATVALWKQMNGWVYEGFDTTYNALGVNFDKLYYESDTYLLGKEMVDDGLKKEIFYQKEDNSVWIDLTGAKLDHKLLLRSDGTSVYITQDLGTARLRYQDFGVDSMVYVVADEQDYHFKVLFEVLKQMGEPYSAGLHHLSYGLVELPQGRMKTREGTVVDADDLMEEVIAVADSNANERGALEDLTNEEKKDIIRKVGLGALKYFIIRVHPKKSMIFNPEESVDMQGQTGPYIQYAAVRVQALVRRAEKEGIQLDLAKAYQNMEPQELELIKGIYQFPEIIAQAAADFDPSHIANYAYHMAKEYSKFWHDVSVFSAEEPSAVAFRIVLSKAVGQVIGKALYLLGIEVPQKM